MPRGAPALKLAITVDRDVHAKVIEAAAQDDMSVSAWLTEAARRAIKLREGLEAVGAWEAQHGALTAHELQAARKRITAAISDRAPRPALAKRTKRTKRASSSR